jgi:hypothetical protein
MAIEITFSYIPVNSYTGSWQPAHQTAARHHEAAYGVSCFYVEVSEEQFSAVIKTEPQDLVTKAETDKLGQIYTRFSVRNRADDFGRSYSDGQGHNVYLLSVGAAERHVATLTALSEQAQLEADIKNGRSVQRERA